MKNNLYIGLMSGTSLDAVDAVLVDFGKKPLTIIATHSEPVHDTLRQKILDLCHPGKNAIQRMGEVDHALGMLFANASLNLLKKTNYSSKDIRAIGSHGQTIRHEPNHSLPFTLQIGDPNIIVTQTGITTVADFRRRDMALGGQAAPLAPAFHNYLLRTEKENRWVVNIGGITNITLLAADAKKNVLGFDTGPGNTLLDAWCFRHTKNYYDKNGDWAASGRVNQDLLNILLSDPYFKITPPKSTGREYFNLNWLEQYLKKISGSILPKDIQATLVDLTAQSICGAINKNGSVWVCGGGAKNHYLMQRLKELCGFNIMTTEKIGIHPDWIEACAFAWLARQTLLGKPGNLPSVTGARAFATLGAIYPK